MSGSRPPRAERTTRIATGIVKVFRRGVWSGYRAAVWVPDPRATRGGRMVLKRFPKTATISAMKTWREDTRRLLPTLPVPPVEPTPSGFAADVARYLDIVKAMPSLSDRRLHLQDWTLCFGQRTRATITSAEIRAQRDRWLTTGPRRQRERTPDGWRWIYVPKPLAPASVNRRLRALENLWTILDGPHAPNPVRDVPECDEPPPLARGTSFAVIEEILAAMPARTQPVKGVKGSRDRPSKTHARIAVELWTGLAHSQLAQLRDVHVDFETLTYHRPRRKKGRRGERNRPVRPDRPLPLLPQAAAALKHFFAIGASGPFSRSALYKSFKRAIAAANAARVEAHRQSGAEGQPSLIPTSLRPYDVKHTFGGEAYRASKDLRAVQELLGLSRLELADRYAHAAVAPAVAEAAAHLALRASETRSEHPTPQAKRA